MGSATQMATLARLLTQTLGGNVQAIKDADNQLRSAEVTPGFGLVLLQLLRDNNVDNATRQAGAIYFKNYIRRQWSVEGAGAGISESDRQTIKQHLLSLMLQAPKPVQVQLSAGLEEISVMDYPERWPSLLPEMVQHLRTSQDMCVLKGTMQTAHTVFLKFRSQSRSETLLKEIKYTVELFQQVHLEVFTAAVQRIMTGTLPADQLVTHFEFLLATVGTFFSLNVVDLPEFFEDHREQYFQGFLAIFRYNNPAVAGSGDQQGLAEQVKGAICECFALYTDKYQEEFSPYLNPCVTHVGDLLLELDQQEKNDQLVAKGIKFLSSAAATKWAQSPFENPAVLESICRTVVFPNINLRDSDVELFEDNPLEYVRRDMEAADQDTRRRSAMDLVKAMGKFNEARVTEILQNLVRQLLEQSRQQPPEHAERSKDAVIYLCIAMTVRGQTQREGVTMINQSVNLGEYFNGLVAPALTSADPITSRSVLRASCLKFVTVFRNQLTREQIGTVLPAVCRCVGAESPVIHTYAAICLEKLMTVKDRNAQGQVALRYDPATMRASFLQVVEPMLQIIAQSKGIEMNEYIMRTIARIFSFLKEQGGEVGLRTLPNLALIVGVVSANPSNPVFNHNLFEAVASIVKVCVPVQPDAVEGTLLPALVRILEQNVADFLPYTFQILGLLLDATSSVKPMYQGLFERLLTPELWRAHANVPGLVRLLRAYFNKHAVFGELLQANMQQIIERFGLVLNNRKTEGAALELLNAMIMHLPIAFYQAHFKTLVQAVLIRLHSGQSPRLKRDFVTTASLFMHRDQMNLFPKVTAEIQPGLLLQLVSGIWLPVLKMSLRLDERKVCTMGVVKLLALDEVKANPQVISGLCQALVQLLGLTPSASAAVVEEEEEEEVAPNGGAGLEFEVSFSRLRNTDLPGAQGGLAPDIPDLHAAALAALRPQAAGLAQLAQQSPELQPLAQFAAR